MTAGARDAAADALYTLLRGEAVSWRALGVAPEDILRVCADEEVPGLVHERLQAAAHAVDWPEALCTEVARLARADAARELLRHREIAGVLGALAAAGVYPVLFKGTALAYGTYAAPGLRPRMDTDLLVRRHEIDAVRRVLTGIGYVAPPCCDGEVLFRQFALAKADGLGVEHVVDVHWQVSTHSMFADLLTGEELAEGAVPVTSLGPGARAAGPVHALLLACVHPAMHHRNLERLLWVYDTHLLAGRLSQGEAERFTDLALSRGVGAICAHALARARARMRTRFPQRLVARLASARAEPSSTFLRPGRRWRHEMVSNLRAVRSWTDRARLIREVLFPSARYMLGSYAVRNRTLGLALLPALYLHRNAYGMWKVLAGRK